MQRAQVNWLPDGKRMHLHHGPIDMIVDASGPGRDAALLRAVRRFDTLLEELVAELPRLRSPSGPPPVAGTARRMTRAIEGFALDFITPMAAVAGAGADTVLHAMLSGPGVTKAYVNNGGDVAFYLTSGHMMRAAIATRPEGQITIEYREPVRGIATSGRSGRSHSLGIADAVTVLARNAAAADAAATMIANAVDLPGHPGIIREPANDIAPDSDLGARLVTTHVGHLTDTEVDAALDAGSRYANKIKSRSLIYGALLCLRGCTQAVGHLPHIQMKDPLNA
ncbi:MAG: UPF0280 family protein [Pseudomonadota bacterium]